MSGSLQTMPDFDEARARARIIELEQCVQERTARLDDALKELDAIAHSVSHDLRAPLRGIAGFSRSLAEEHGAKLDAEGARMVSLIRDEARRMSELIEGMLVFSRVGRQRLEPSDIDMTELARSAFQAVTELRPVPAPDFVVQTLPHARGDRVMVRQVFAALLGNAVKFTGQASAPRIEISGWNTDAWSTYCVADNGVGFDPRYAHKLFGVFQRLHSADEFEGAGVGLAVVHRIVHRHGGKTWAEGKAGEGAKFYFTLPGIKEGAR